jgi:hypothetical protein
MIERRLIGGDQGVRSRGISIVGGPSGFDSNCPFGGPIGEKSRLVNPAKLVPIFDTLPRIPVLLR